jgi:hypothetical protein
MSQALLPQLSRGGFDRTVPIGIGRMYGLRWLRILS